MATYVAMLRGINVGGRAKVAMAELRQLFADLGHTDVQTYIQSGNVVFATRAARERVAVDLEQRIGADLGVDVTVVLRTAQDLARIVAKNPFVGRGADPSTLHVTFLAGAAGSGAAGRLDAPDAGPDELIVAGRDVYLHCPNGYGRTKLNNTFIERRLGARATTRNWRTVTKLLELASA
jgi:uncharacterized protein (DUF1697 family)